MNFRTKSEGFFHKIYQIIQHDTTRLYKKNTIERYIMFTLMIDDDVQWSYVMHDYTNVHVIL